MRMLFILIFLIIYSTSSVEAQTCLCIRTAHASTAPCIMAEAARTDAEHRIGLMHRQSLLPHEGMLFFYHPPQPIFMWMKNTLVALDIVFLDHSRTIIHRELNAQPHDLTPRGTSAPVAYVLEVPHGTASAYQMDIGTKLIWNNP
ncbi:MAG: DUF192 domain-containing protein [Alphaproteobacteria bacterium]|nr:MAG: DUF192 domain-containing protein [Alphaproteobacteria bacterium]